MMADADYAGYVELCKKLGLPYAPTDIVEESNHKIMKALLERIKKLEDNLEHYTD
jgi:hypothetical protein